MKELVYISFENETEKHITDLKEISLDLGLSLVKTFSADNINFNDIEASKTNSIFVINAANKKIEALELCKRIQKITANNSKILILVEDAGVEESNKFGFYSAYLTKIKNLKNSLKNIVISNRINKDSKIILFHHIGDSEDLNFKAISSLAKLLPSYKLSSLILETCNKAIFADLLKLNKETSLLSKIYNSSHINIKDLVKSHITNIENIDQSLYLKSFTHYYDEIKIEAKLDKSFSNLIFKNLNLLSQSENLDAKLVNEIKSELSQFSNNKFFNLGNCLNIISDQAEYILVNLGNNLNSFSSKYLLKKASNILISFNHEKYTEDFIDLRDTLSNEYQINSIAHTDKNSFESLGPELQKSFIKSDVNDLDLYKFINKPQYFFKSESYKLAMKLSKQLCPQLVLNLEELKIA